MNYLYFWIATFLGVGKLPKAPGTWASLVAAILFYPLIETPWVLGGLLAGIFFVGVLACDGYSKGLKDPDPSSAVIDEVLGMGIAMLAIPKAWPYVVMAFILFRLFDIWKPFPIRRLEKLPGGWGIMADDLMAGLYARLWVQIGLWTIYWIQ
ncbi:MAG TPA: phosphatidylglycerophosphatase A [bacterium]|nr:phosphatidylglycerophosphatase A [bacterium]